MTSCKNRSLSMWFCEYSQIEMLCCFRRVCVTGSACLECSYICQPWERHFVIWLGSRSLGITTTNNNWFNKRKTRAFQSQKCRNNEGAGEENVIEYLYFRSSLLWCWSLQRKQKKRGEPKYTQRHTTWIKLEKYWVIRKYIIPYSCHSHLQ